MALSQLKFSREELLEVVFPKYSFQQTNLFLDLPIPVSHKESDPKEHEILLPEWASDLGIGLKKTLSVPSSCVLCGSGWEDVDWFRAIFEFLTCDAESKHELSKAPVHSYRARLPKEIWWQSTRPWVNRILLFLKRWVSWKRKADEQSLFGSGKAPVVYLSHDVDYVEKTLPLRAKKAAFQLWNIHRSTDVESLGMLRECVSSAFSPGDYWQFPKIRALEESYDVRSIWNFYARRDGKFRTPTQMLLDPSYSILSPRVQKEVARLRNSGYEIGLHQAFGSWKDSDDMLVEKLRLEEVTQSVVSSCRQHWLKFGFEYTWAAQEKAGFSLDLTLGFNEVESFRNGAALRLPAWILSEGRFSKTLYTVPLVLMDSHLFDYGSLNVEQRRTKIDAILDELLVCEGEISVVWHQRVFHADYDWGSDYEYLLVGMKLRGITASIEC